MRWCLVGAVIVIIGGGIARAEEPQWMTLPPTPTLPDAAQGGVAPVNGIKIWYAIFGPASGEPVILLHGGLAHANYWGNQVRALRRAIGSSSWTVGGTAAAPATISPTAMI